MMAGICGRAENLRTKEIPRAGLYEIPLREDPLALEDELKIARVIDENAGRKSRHC
jgi:hypothetical protein